MKQISTTAIILKRINFGEADRILTVLTPDQGHISVLAKGARRQKSKLAGGLELFSESEITYIDGKSDLKTLVSTRLKKHYDKIVTNIDKTMITYDAMKAVEKSSQHSTDSDYFDLMLSALDGFNDLELEPSLVICWFVGILMMLNGNNINLEKPTNAEEFNESESYEFSYDDMSFFKSEQGAYTPKHIKFLRLASRVNDPKLLNKVIGASSLSSDLVPLFKNLLKFNTA